MSHATNEPLYTLRTAASRVGLSPRTLRLYEEAGLLEPVRIGGNAQRLYSDQDLHWLRCIRDMIHGEKLTVEAIRRLLDLIPCWEIRHCSPEQAAICGPALRIPQMASTSPSGAMSSPQTPPEPASHAVEIKLIYGVKEFGAVLPCSRCIYAERILRKVAEKHDDDVVVRKLDIASEEAARYGALLPPTIIIEDELIASGQGVSEARLEQALKQHLPGSE